MSEYNFDSYPEGEWDDRDDLIWNEFDWQQYLRQSEGEIGRFLGYFRQLKGNFDHIDEIARKMGWEESDWSLLDDLDEAEIIEQLDDCEVSPYTLHKHPLYIVSHGLYLYLRISHEQFLTAVGDKALTPRYSWEFAQSLHAGEMNAVMAINALDVGDFALTVCHLKNALSALNHSLKLVNDLPPRLGAAVPAFQKDASLALFDLREVWLRVMSDCREVCKRDSGEG